MYGLSNIIDLNKAAGRLAKRRDSQQEKQDVQEEDCPVIAQLAFTVGAPGGSSAGHLFQLEDGLSMITSMEPFQDRLIGATLGSV